MTCSVGEAVVQTFVVTEQKEVRNQGAYQMVGGAVGRQVMAKLETCAPGLRATRGHS